MPARNKIFTESQRSPYRSKKKIWHVDKRNLSPIVENRPRREPHRTATYLTIILGTLCVILCICLAVLLPLLILGIIQTSPSTSTFNSIYSGNLTVNNSNTTTLSSGTSTSSSSSTTNSAAVTTGVTATTSTSANGYTIVAVGNCSTSPHFCAEDVTISCSANLINMTILIIVQKTVNATYWSNTNSNFWGGTVNQTYSDNGSEIAYLWSSVSGQTIQASGSPYKVEAQFLLTGVVQPTSSDTYSVVATTAAGLTSTVSGHF